MTDRRTVFTIAPGSPFLPTLAAALLDGRLIAGRRYRDDPLGLADVTLFLPTRRAVREFSRVLAVTFSGGAAILPRIRAVSDAAEEIGTADEPLPTPAALDLPPVIGNADRHLMLADLVARWREHIAGDRHLSPSGAPILVPNSPADALRLSADLIALIDQATLEGIDWKALASLVPDELSAWWQMTLVFLGIATEALPAAVAEAGFIDARGFERRSLEAAISEWKERPPKGPTILAGSTGSVALTADLAAAIAGLDLGAVVLPGLDLGASADEIVHILAEPSHPQHSMRRLMTRLGVDGGDVVALGAPDRAARDRTDLVAAALLPAALTDRWPEVAAKAEADPDGLDAALAGLAVVDARNEAEEALTAALALREAIEVPGARAMLVTPDRTVARRVIAELARFNVEVEDTAGLPLPQSPYGGLALLVADAVAEGLPPVKLASLLARPLATFGLDPGRARAAGRLLERHVLRGPRLAPTPAALVDAARRAVSDGAPADVALIAERLVDALAPLVAVSDHPRSPLAAFIEAEVATLAAVTAPREGGERTPGRGETMLLGLLDGYARADGELALSPGDWPAVLKALIGNVLVRTPSRRAAIIVTGPIEARLVDVDRMVLAGLNEGSWPLAVDVGPWLSRQMRKGLGLTPPELRIGLSAHDFAEALGSREAVLIRSTRAGGAPTVPSRFLQRLDGLLGPDRAAALRAAGRRYRDWARRLDDRPGVARCVRPEPKPPLSARPDHLSVTEIETLIRDPYAIYARRVLGLEPLDELGELPDFATRGSLVHAILKTFAESWRGPYNAAAVDALRALGETRLAEELADHPQVLALWRPRFHALAEFVVRNFEARRLPLARHAEIKGIWQATPDFALNGRADRIDVMADGKLAIVDFKTGRAPTDAQIATGMSPQLPLEAAIARHGGFEGLAAAEAEELIHVVLKGLDGRDAVRPYRGYRRRDGTVIDVAATVDDAERRLIDLIRAYGDPKRGYPSRARPFRRGESGPYDHLARVGEWSLGGDPGDGSGGETDA